MKEAEVIERWTEKCGCKKCNTYAEFFKYDCGCIRVDIYNDGNRCAQCTNFSKKRYIAPRCR